MKPRSKLKQYGSLDGALKAANDRPFLRIGDTYLVPNDPNGTYELGALVVQIVAPCDEERLRASGVSQLGGSIKVSTIDAASKGYKLPAPAGFDGISARSQAAKR